ncbi:hypothetical protein GCM10022278_13050 [Allohahella marinimesophila]|uniref:Siderophore synthetase component n=1 Tax=Allohahella marinimesophila TaxID=1054972 RepID=A0ABP7NXF2_9GAMM
MSLDLDGLTLVCLVRVTAFGRIRLQDEQVHFLNQQGHTRLADWRSIVNALPVETTAKARLQAELGQTVRLCTWNNASLDGNSARRHLNQDALESAIHEGHLYHPSFKARLGFTLGDHVRFGPESAKGFALEWLAVRRTQLHHRLPEPAEAFAERELGREAWDHLGTALFMQQASWDDYMPVPIHPWQWQHLSQALQPALTRGDIIHLGLAGDEYCATQSLRTLQNRAWPSKANLKLPLNVVNTSSVRSLDSHSVCTAPVVSQWLRDVVATNAFLSERGLVILQEYAGLLYCPADACEAEALDGQLGAIWRESLHPYLQPDESAVPMTALMLTEADGKPFVHHWIVQHGLAAWLARLIEVAVLPVWHLFVEEGIAVEAHAQNSILIHRDGWPERLALRDFHDSVEYVEGFLKRPELKPDFAKLNAAYAQAPEDRYYWMSSIEALRELVMDTLFVFNLADLSWLLETHYDMPESLFWQHVRRHLLQHVQTRNTTAERWTAVDVDAGFVPAESLLAQKLGMAQQRHLIPNTLSPLQHKRSYAHVPCERHVL